MIDSILHWNQVALDAVKADFTTADPAVNPSPEQVGPTRTSRALAIVHLAMHDAWARVHGNPTYLPYTSAEVPATSDPQGARAAVAAAACLTLISLYGRQKATFLAAHEKFLGLLGGHDPDVAAGLDWGSLVARRMLAERAGDGSDAPDAFYAPSTEPGRHRPDPLAPQQGYLGPLWGRVRPFGIDDLVARLPGMDPPQLPSTRYAQDFDEVRRFGSAQGSARNAEQTTVGLYWAYDGARNIGLPPRLYNQVVRAIATTHGSTEAQHARLFALVNVAMADAGIQAWAEKYRHNVWRPVLGVRESDPGWGPSGLGDGNAETAGDAYWVPLGAPATNQPGKVSATPPFPAYPSGHATFGTAALRVTALELGIDEHAFAFKFVSDELDGTAVGAEGIRPRHERPLTIERAIEENLSSRVYLGVHWRFDGDEGKANGAAIAALIQGAFPGRA